MAVVKEIYSKMFDEVKNYKGEFPFELDCDELEKEYARDDVVDTFSYFLSTNFITGNYEDQFYKLILQVDSSNIDKT